MKKLQPVFIFLFFACFIKAQTPPFAKPASTNSMVIHDTLHYYLNKHYFKTGDTSMANYPYYYTDATAMASFTNITYCGSIFEVPPGETVVVTGLEAFASKNLQNGNLGVPVKLYLFNIDAATGLPKPLIVDSVSTIVATNGLYPTKVGGNFTSTLTLAARTMTSAFGVAVRNMAPIAGDFARFYRTDAVTPSNWNGPKRYSDGYGFVRYKSTFYSTADFTLNPAFGTGTSYEFMVAPRVTYTAQLSQTFPAGVVSVNDTENVADTMCTRGDLIYTNTSSKFFEHRQYNLNSFYRKWNLYDPLYFPSYFSADSSITWSFEYYDNVPPGNDSRKFLPYVNTGTINAPTGYAVYPDCFTDNEFRGRLKPMGAKARVAQYVFNEKFIVCLRFCNGDTVGLSKLNNYNHLKVYPNPAAGGKTTISGLTGSNSILVYNMLGQAIIKEITESANFEVNLAKQPKGTYVVRIANSENKVKVFKILNDH
ncbi:hypothetical protein CNR22_19515 [Sphingobacteriaceae bacterium]|nr:hypothetical protein CNR22_19515 [Sphingobacteriaceae bacterium]